MQAPLKTKNGADTAQTDGARTVVQNRGLADDRPGAVAQRELAEMMNNSPRVLQQVALSDAIHNSPRMVAQRHDMQALFGGTVTSRGGGALPAAAPLAQREETNNKTGLPSLMKSGIESPQGVAAFAGLNGIVNHPDSAFPVQRTVYKIASAGPEFHETDPARYSGLMKDTHVSKSLHEYKPSEIDLNLSTSPMTIFMHGSTMSKWNARTLFDFLEERNYKPKPDSDIVFITCKGAMLMDDFFVSKGQALANLLGARVHLAHGIVKIDSEGVPYVENEGAGGLYEYVKSEAELGRILAGVSAGWATYQPERVTYDMLRAAIRRGKRQLSEFAVLPACTADVSDYAESYEDIEEEMAEDRSHVVERHESVLGIQAQMETRHRPRLTLHKLLEGAVRRMEELAGRTIKHRDRALALGREFALWTEIVGTGKGDVIGVGLLLQDKQAEWIAPLQASIEDEESEAVPVQPGDGWGDLSFDDLLVGEPGEGEGNEAPREQKAVTSLKRNALATAPAPIQRQMIENERATVTGETLTQIVANLPDIDLVRNDSGIDLSISFKSIDPYGVTRLKANGVVVDPRTYITPETASEQYLIEIELNKEFYTSGQSLKSIGSLIETLTHEWSLHGAQHAVNINSARHGLHADLHVDHESLFSNDMNHMDFAIALQIHRHRNSLVGGKIYEAYLNDVVAHQEIVKKGWDGDDLYYGQELINHFRELVTIKAALTNSKEVSRDLMKVLGELEFACSYYLDHYEGLDMMDNFDIGEVKTLIKTLGEFDLAQVPEMTSLIPGIVNKLSPLLVELEEVLSIQKIADPTAARKRALQELSVNVDALDTEVETITGLDEQVDFEASSKKRH